MSSVIKETRELSGAVVVRATGEITIEHSPSLHKSLVEICAQKPDKLVLNLSEVNHIDSSGVGTLVEIYRRIDRINGRMYLVGMTRQVRGVFEITKLDQFFLMADTEEEALES
jgi:anti-anti-sigma factor